MSHTSSNTSSSNVVVAMSGGVDSSVAALLLAQAGQSAVGISMQVWDYRNNGGCQSRATCCAPDDFTDARRVAAKIGIPYYVFDFEDVFRKQVIDRFVQTYERGQTPNPCIDCNARVKFKVLRERARAMGHDKVATGHYAMIEQREDGYHLLRSVDLNKDQTYFLFNLTQSELADTLFPVGHLTKDKVRALAEQYELCVADKAESQDICFIPGDKAQFLTKLGAKRLPGKIVNQSGGVLADHQGIHDYTVGQRKGLNIGGQAHPLYVLRIDADANQVVVGDHSELERSTFAVSQLNWVSPQLLALAQNESFEFTALAQLRHRHAGVSVKVKVNQDKAHVEFTDQWGVVAPGQACVFYDLENKEVLGGGRILG